MEILAFFVKVAYLLANTMAPFFIITAILLRDRTLGMQERSRWGFCGGHEIFQAYIDGP